MDYIKPFGVTTPGRPAYKNGNPAAGIQGSIPDVACWEYPQREIVAVIEGAGLTASNGDLTQLYKAILALTTTSTPSIGSLWHIGSAAGGAPSAILTNLSPTVPSGSTNFFFSVPITSTNTLAGSPPKTTVDYGDGPKTIVSDDTGSNAPAGAMPGGVSYVAIFFYDGTNARLINPTLPSLTNFVAQPGSAALLNPQVFYLREFRGQSIAPSNFTTGGQWTNRVLNDATAGATITGATLNTSTGAVYLPDAGTYKISAFAFAHGSALHQIRVLANGNPISASLGGTADAHAASSSGTSVGDTTNPSVALEFIVTLPAASTLYLQHAAFGDSGFLGKRGDDSTGYTTFLDAAMNITKYVGAP